MGIFEQHQGQGRVGRRIVATFLLFALLPLLGFAWFARHHVAAKLTESAHARLRGDVTTSGVILTERLTLAANQISGRDGLSEGKGYVARQAVTEVRPAGEVGLLDDTIRRDVENLGIALRARRDGTAWNLWLVAPVPGETDLVAGRLDPEYLYAPGGLERPPASVSIHLPDGTLLRRLGPGPPSSQVLRDQGLGTSVRGELRWRTDGEERMGQFREVFLTPQFGMSLVVAVHDSRAGILRPLAIFERAFLLVVLLTTAAVILAALIRVRRIMTPVSMLVKASEGIARQEFTTRVDIAGADEFTSLGRAFNAMSEDLQHRAGVMAAVSAFGRTLAGAMEPDTLLRQLLDGAVAMFRVDGVLIHSVGTSNRLEARQICIKSLGLDETALPAFRIPGEAGAGELPTRESFERAVRESLQDVAAAHDYTLRAPVILPMIDHAENMIGSLTLFNAEDVQGQPAPLEEETIALARALASQAAVALANVRLRHEYKTLFDAMIETLALAVDKKSAYTGEHCRRVPRLAMMILDAIQEVRSGPLAGASFTEEEAYEMQVAALLHDCGKVVTPIHVIDKATKLETIWDRIRLIEQRLTVAAREREVMEYRQAAGAAGVDLTSIERRVAGVVDAMREDCDFLRRTNSGAEFMRDEDIARVEAIGTERTWRDLDGRQHALLDDDEIMNLTIRKGTLNDEERRIVNYHMDATIQMLDRLPFPRGLKDVPRIAGSHHERMDGGGFPCGLTAEEIPLRGRILAVADVFEALTAVNRPYKKGKKLSEALRIMAYMARDGHLDPDVFLGFLDARVWERYAADTLPDELCDRVDVPAIRSLLPGGRPGRVERLSPARQ